MKNKFLPLFAMGIAMVAGSAQAGYIVEAFNTNPILSPTQTAGAWYTDRYAPKHFDSQFFDGDNRLRIGISAEDGVAPNAVGPGRTGGFTGTFYNTQGRKFDLNNGIGSVLKAQIYVGSDWLTNKRRSDMWISMNDPNHFPIIGFANVTGNPGDLVCRVYDSNNPNGWVNIPGAVATNRWYTVEMRLKAGFMEFYVDNNLVFVDTNIGNGNVMTNAMLQAYNFNDPALPPAQQTVGDSYNVYWDNFVASPGSSNMHPVDLNGTYRAPSSGPLNPSGPVSATGFAVAATTGIGSGSVIERSGINSPVENVNNGTFTPFNDTTKVPNNLVINNSNGTSYEAEVELSGTWKAFEWGQGTGNVPPFATGDTFAVGYSNFTNSYGVQFVKDSVSGNFVARIASVRLSTGSLGVLDTSDVDLGPGTTKVRVNGSVAGNFFSASVTPLDGPFAFTQFPIGSTNGTNLTTNIPWTLDFSGAFFVAGFETHEHVAAKANATVTNFSTSAVGNSMFLFADDPYVRSADGTGAIKYRLGQANLLQEIAGFQAFMNAQPGQTFWAGSYAGPYSSFQPPVITAALDAAGAGASNNQVNSTIASLFFNPAVTEVATSAGFRPNSGSSVNLFAGGAPNFFDINATTTGSNTVLVDNTAPVLTLGLGGSAYVAPNVVVGSLDINAIANDLGAQQSGLDKRPTGQITWSDSSTTPIDTSSLSANSFRATIPITSGTPNGPATLSLNVVDRAGNTTTTTLTFNVSTVNVTLTLIEEGVTANVNRVVRITVGGTGGASAPITLEKEVNFNVATMVGPVNSRQGTVVITYQDLDTADGGPANSVNPAAVLTDVYAKDKFFSLGKKETLAGSMGNYTGGAVLRMGDVTDNNIVNVSDLAVWTANNGLAMNPHTTIGQAVTPRQANIDGAGTVGLFDRNLVISSWLMIGDGNTVGNFRGEGDGRQTVKEVIDETGLPKAVVLSMDLNGDNWITREEVLSWKPTGTKK